MLLLSGGYLAEMDGLVNFGWWGMMFCCVMLAGWLFRVCDEGGGLDYGRLYWGPNVW